MPGRQSRRSVLATIAALPLTGALSACGGGGGDTRSGGTSSTGRTVSSRTGRKTRITFWSALRGSQEVVDAFNRGHDTHPGRFPADPLGGAQGGYAKLSNAARAGNAPDIATLEYPQVPGFAIDGVCRDITDLVGDGLRRETAAAGAGADHLREAGVQRPARRGADGAALPHRPLRAVRAGRPPHLGRVRGRGQDRTRQGGDRRMALFPTDGDTHARRVRVAGRAPSGSTPAGGAWNVSLADAPTRRVAAYWQRLIDEDLVFMNAVESRHERRRRSATAWCSAGSAARGTRARR